MYSRVMQLVNACDGRYLTDDEEREVLGYAESLPRRLAIAQQVEKVEEKAVQDALAELRRRYPRFPSRHDRGWEKVARDMQLVLRYAVQGMVAADADMATDKRFAWLKTLLRASGHTAKIVAEAYELLRDDLRRRLPADALAPLEPHLDKMIAVMGDLAPPLQEAVE